jgi:hypothetical protein
MAWYFFIRKDNGDLVSEGSVVPPNLSTATYDTMDVGERPDWGTNVWDPATRQLVARPIPILIDRLDDIQARFLADPDFAAVWAGLNATRRTQLRLGIMRVLAQLIGGRRFRQESEAVELD